MPGQIGRILPPRGLTGQPSGKWSGVQRRKSGQPRSRSTMAHGPRVAWHRVRLGSSTRSFSHLGMYTAQSRGWITAQQRGAFRRPEGGDSGAHCGKTPPCSDPLTQVHLLTTGFATLQAITAQNCQAVFLNGTSGRSNCLCCRAGPCLRTSSILRPCPLNASRTLK